MPARTQLQSKDKQKQSQVEFRMEIKNSKPKCIDANINFSFFWAQHMQKYIIFLFLGTAYAKNINLNEKTILQVSEIQKRHAILQVREISKTAQTNINTPFLKDKMKTKKTNLQIHTKDFRPLPSPDFQDPNVPENPEQDKKQPRREQTSCNNPLIFVKTKWNFHLQSYDKDRNEETKTFQIQI